MNGGVEIDIDIYGKYARLSAVADWIEKLAADGVEFSEADLVDYISDNEWRFPEIWSGENPEEDNEELEEGDQDELTPARRNARSIFAIIEERGELLGQAYPFTMDGTRLALRSGVNLVQSSYAVLWAVTLCHAYRLVSTPKPTEVFEIIVSEVLRSDRVASVNFGELRRNSGSFPDALRAAGNLLKVPVDPRRAIYNRRAQDERADTIGHMSWGDMRPGLWCIVGQATCAKSDEWEAKIVETATVPWTGWLGSWISPTPFLAVPHHVESKHMARLVETGQRIVLDRLRLGRFERTINDNDRVLIEAVIESGSGLS